MATRTGPLFRWALFLIFGLALAMLHPGVQPGASQEDNASAVARVLEVPRAELTAATGVGPGRIDSFVVGRCPPGYSPARPAFA